MKHNLGFISYTFATLASMCLVSGLLLLTGGDIDHDTVRDACLHDR